MGRTRIDWASSSTEGVLLQDLRRTRPSLTISAGANVKVVQKLLGHKTAVLTLDRRGHMLPDDLDAVAAAFKTAAGACGRLGLHPVWLTPDL